MGRFERLKNPSYWRRLSIASWKAPNDPTVFFSFPIDFSQAQSFLEKINSDSPVKITQTHFIAKSLALTLARYPELNGIIRWRCIYLRKTVDIFLQVAIAEKSEGERPDLSGAKIESCETKSLLEIASELKEKSRMIRERKDPQFKKSFNLLRVVPAFLLTWIIRLMSFLIHNLGIDLPRLGLPADPFGSAMVTNVGSLGMESGFAPLLPMSRSPLIVCVGEVRDKPWVVDGQVQVRPIIDLGISLDHRFIDGLSGSRMANYFKKIIENPEDYI